MNYKVYDMKGAEAGTIELNDGIFAVPVNPIVIHEAVKQYLANQRQGTQSTLTRTEVRGGGRKPWRQKGTGRARQGSIRAPQWTHGGVALGPKPRSYRITMNKKAKRLALKSAFSSKVAAEEFIVVDSLAFDAPKTKKMVEVLAALNAAGKKALIVVDAKSDANDIVISSARNIEGVKTLYVNTLNVYDIIKHDVLIMTKDAVNKTEEVYA
jgi:large subunit ribosomal protein L4